MLRLLFDKSLSVCYVALNTPMGRIRTRSILTSKRLRSSTTKEDIKNFIVAPTSPTIFQSEFVDQQMTNDVDSILNKELTACISPNTNEKGVAIFSNNIR